MGKGVVGCPSSKGAVACPSSKGWRACPPTISWTCCDDGICCWSFDASHPTDSSGKTAHLDGYYAAFWQFIDTPVGPDGQVYAFSSSTIDFTAGVAVVTVDWPASIIGTVVFLEGGFSVPFGTTILSKTGNTITLSNPASLISGPGPTGAVLISSTFGDVTINGVATDGSAVITGTQYTQVFASGTWAVADAAMVVPTGTTITVLGDTSILLSAVPTGTWANDPIVFYPPSNAYHAVEISTIPFTAYQGTKGGSGGLIPSCVFEWDIESTRNGDGTVFTWPTGLTVTLDGGAPGQVIYNSAANAIPFGLSLSADHNISISGQWSIGGGMGSMTPTDFMWPGPNLPMNTPGNPSFGSGITVSTYQTSDCSGVSAGLFVSVGRFNLGASPSGAYWSSLGKQTVTFIATSYCCEDEGSGCRPMATGSQPASGNCSDAMMMRDGKLEPVKMMASKPGAGHHLTKILTGLGFEKLAGCGCASRAAEMDRRGVQWCKDNVATITGWMKEECDARKLPFDQEGAEFIVGEAIRAAVGDTGEDPPSPVM